MMVKKVKGAILIGIVGTTLFAILLEAVVGIGGQTNAEGKLVNPTGWGLNIPKFPSTLADIPDFGLLGQFSLLGSFSKIGVVSVVLLVFTLLLADFFDTMGTMVAIGAEAGLLDKEGTPPHAQKILASTRWQPLPAARPASAATRHTSSRPPESARARVPAWPRS